MCIRDSLCTAFEGQVRGNDHEGEPKWWKISELDQIDMQNDIRERLPLSLIHIFWELALEVIDQSVAKGLYLDE